MTRLKGMVLMFVGCGATVFSMKEVDCLMLRSLVKYIM